MRPRPVPKTAPTAAPGAPPSKARPGSPQAPAPSFRPERVPPWKKPKEGPKPLPAHENGMDYEEVEDSGEAEKAQANGWETEAPEDKAVVSNRPASKYGGPTMPTTAKQPPRAGGPISKQAAAPVAKSRAKPLLQQDAKESWGAEDTWEDDEAWSEDGGVQNFDGVEHGDGAGKDKKDDNDPWLQPMPKHRSSASPTEIAPALPKGSWSSSSPAKARPLRLRRPDELAAELADNSGGSEPLAKRPKAGAGVVVPESLQIAAPQPKTATAKCLPRASAGKTLQLVTNPKASAAMQAYLRNPAAPSLPVPKASYGALAPPSFKPTPKRGVWPPGGWEG